MKIRPFLAAATLAFTTASLTATALAKEALPDAVAKDRARNLVLPKNDYHYKTIKSYIEESPDADYLHASEAAHEAFRDIKFAVRLHWGIYSINEINGESWPYLRMSGLKKTSYNQLYKTFNPVGFNADEWMDFFKRSGLQCFAFTTKHHEGFSMFHTKTRVKQRMNYEGKTPRIEPCDLAYSIEETPFKRDIVKELCDSARKHGIKIDLYFSHPDWYDADFRTYCNHPLRRPPLTSEERTRMIARHREQLHELLTNYGKIDALCLDMWLGKDVWPQLRDTVKMMRKLQPDIMLRCRGIGNYGDYYTPEGFVPGSKENTNLPWMTIYPLASSFSYDSNPAKYKGTPWIVWNLVDAVSKGGAFMVGIGPDKNGKFHPKAIEQLEAAGDWLKVNGKGIYETRARKNWKEGDDKKTAIRYTSSKDEKTVYAFTKFWPGTTFTLTKVTPVPESKIYLLGYPEPLKWTARKGGGVKIEIPERLQAEKSRPGKDVWGFQIQASK